MKGVTLSWTGRASALIPVVLLVVAARRSARREMTLCWRLATASLVAFFCWRSHHAQHGLTCAIIYGTAINVEKTILGRLRNVGQEAEHPLLLVGILAEIELVRHTGLVDSMTNEVEAKIHELDSRSSDRRDHRIQSKREVLLNLSYLRNSIIT